MKALIGLVCLIGLGCFGCEIRSSESDEVPAGHVQVDLPGNEDVVIPKEVGNSARCGAINCDCEAKCKVDEQPIANCMEGLCICVCLCGDLPKWLESGEGVLETEKEIWEILQPLETPESKSEAERLIDTEDGE